MSMRVGLFSGEGRNIPNLALMKLSANAKAKGAEVFLDFPIGAPYDASFGSCIFSWNAERLERDYGALCDYTGGSGVDLGSELPFEIEHTRPDYELYEYVDYAMGFTSRGCIRRCEFCVVREKEGAIRDHAEIREFWAGQETVRLLDANFLAAPSWRERLAEARGLGVKLDLNQGLDIRLVTEDVASELARVKTLKRGLVFALDSLSDADAFERGMAELSRAGLAMSSIGVYVLLGFAEDRVTELERVRLAGADGRYVFPMRFRGADGCEATPIGDPVAVEDFRAVWDTLRGGRWQMHQLRRWFTTGGGNDR